MAYEIPPQLDIIDDQMVSALRQKTEAQRWAIAHGMWSYARDMIVSILRSEHADWSDAEIQIEAARRLSHGAA